MVGAFAWANDMQVSPGVLRWSDGAFSSMGCGVGWDCVGYINNAGINPVLAITRWQGEVYIGGEISFTRDGITYNGVMRWDGQAWHALGNGVDGKVTSLRVIDGALIVAGWFVHAGGLEVNGLARWDGANWSEVVPVPAFDPNGSNYVNDMAFYQGQWYLGGNLNYVDELVRWDGSVWETVGGGFTGTFAAVDELQVHDGLLYVAGNFGTCPPYGVPSNPGSGIVTWDGSAWDDLGGGTCGSLNVGVFGMEWWNNELYVAGRFDHIGGIEGCMLAKWNGEEWCMLLPPGHIPGGQPIALVVYQDSLYVGGSLTQAGGEPLRGFGKWIGGDETQDCGVLTGVEATGSVARDVLEVYPSPTSSTLRMEVPVGHNGPFSLVITDATGRAVEQSLFPLDGVYDVSQLASGVYNVEVRSYRTGQRWFGRFIRE